jgi:serine/threonine-protein kinase
MVTGRKAFEGNSQASIIAAILTAQPPAVSEIAALSPPALDRTIRRCLEKDADARWQSARDLESELAWISELPIDGGRPGTSTVRASRSRLGLVIGIVVAGLLGGIALWSRAGGGVATNEPVRRIPIAVPSEQQLTGGILATSENLLALAPDGSRLVFAAQTEMSTKLYVRAFDEFEVEPLAGTEGGKAPFYSPDGEWIGFFADGKLQKIPAGGGRPQLICETGSFIISRTIGASWGSDGTIVYFLGGEGLARVAAFGGVPEKLTSPNSEQDVRWHGAPQILPNGKVLFTVGSDAGHRIAVLSLETGDWTGVAGLEEASGAQYLANGTLIFGRAGKLFAVPFDAERLEVVGVPVPVLDGVLTSNLGLAVYSTTSSGSLAYVPGDIAENHLVLVDRNGRTEPLTKEPGVYKHPRFSPDGLRVAADVRVGAHQDIWIFDRDRNTRRRLTFDGFNLIPVWTPDGSRLAFSSVRADSTLTGFWTAADGSGSPERFDVVATEQESSLPWSFSLEGDLVALATIDPPKMGAVLFSTLDGTLIRTLGSNYNESYPVLSPDGRFVAYVSDESGQFEVYVRPVVGPGKWLISQGGGGEPWWRGDGKELFYRRGRQVLVVPARTVPSFSVGESKVLFEGHYDLSGTGDQHYGVTPDGQRFVMTSVAQISPTPIRVVLNWAAELERIVPTDN